VLRGLSVFCPPASLLRPEIPRCTRTKEGDVNKNSLYGSYFKLTGHRLTRGDDFLTVYRTANGESTSIELFKCAGPPK
jgi:hypothetical protein